MLHCSICVISLSLAQMDWKETESLLDKLHSDLSQSWVHLRAIAKQETFTNSISMEKKMKSAKFLSEAAESVKVLQVVHRRVMNRFNRLYVFMGLNPAQAEKQQVSRLKAYTIHVQHVKNAFLSFQKIIASRVSRRSLLSTSISVVSYSTYSTGM